MKDLEDLKAQALSLAAQAPLQFKLSMLPPPTISYGPSLMRYNRVEGLSVGASVEQQLGGGYSGLAIGRLGFADFEPNLELSLARSNLTKTIRFTAYNRLVSASDWGHPLTFGSSFSALMFGRDEGFYYRASGVDLTRTLDGAFGGGAQMEWRLFAEQQRTAAVKTNFAVNGDDFPANLVAQRGGYAGVSAHIDDQIGLDPEALRVFSSLRFESAIGRGDSRVRSRRVRRDRVARARPRRGFAHALGWRIGRPTAAAASLVSRRVARRCAVRAPTRHRAATRSG